VQQAWDNHFAAFAAFDVNRIMLDYDDDSQIATFNDVCFNDQSSPTGYKTYKGMAAIQGFFEALFAQIDKIENVNSIGPDGDVAGGSGGPVVKGDTGGAYTGNVFLTWRTTGLQKPIKLATDTFSFRVNSNNDHVIDLQTIVSTEESTACTPSPGQLSTSGDAPIYAAWDNHFAAFGGKDVDAIMKDYTESSIVQVYDNKDMSYTEFAGLAKIEQMFVDLFAAIQAGRTDPQDPATEGIAVGLLEIDPTYNSVFLAWKSNSHPQATDTFTFFTDTDGKSKISRQNIVVTTKDSAVAVKVII